MASAGADGCDLSVLDDYRLIQGDRSGFGIHNFAGFDRRDLSMCSQTKYKQEQSPRLVEFLQGGLLGLNSGK